MRPVLEGITENGMGIGVRDTTLSFDVEEVVVDITVSVKVSKGTLKLWNSQDTAYINSMAEDLAFGLTGDLESVTIKKR